MQYMQGNNIKYLNLSKDVDFHTKSTTKLCVQSIGTPALLFNSTATSSPKSRN